MCGIAGFLTLPESLETGALIEIAGAMSDVVRHRGPDDAGVWCDAAAGVALGHRRLAIQDLSEQGHQPMLSACGRYVLVYNGEIYNFRELSQELESSEQKFRGHSDTEVLVAAIARWGIPETVTRLRGMFAFAVWDRKEQTLSLVRDRIGIKPLYYGRAGNQFLFGSELKSLRAHPDFKAEIEPAAVALLLRHNYIPGPWSIYRGISKLQPGTILQLDWPTAASSKEVQIESYWSLDSVIERGLANPFSGSYEEAVLRLEELLKEAVRLRMLADVPVGAFLSGGIDSSLIVSLMQEQQSRAVKTFTIGFSEWDYDEAPYANQIANFLETDHTEFYVTPQQARDIIPRLATIYDEPFADMSQIPTCLVSELARRHVTVSLSGDGGDELFCGYQRYFHYSDIWTRIQKFPARQFTGATLEKLSAYLPATLRGDRLKKMAAAAQVNSPEELYALLHRHWDPAEVMTSAVTDPSFEVGFGQNYPSLELSKLKWMALDTKTYLPDDILTKVDRASMQVGLEARVPLLDHHVVEFAWSLPPHYRYEQNRSKKILRSVLEKSIPPRFFERPKSGFGIPIGSWLQTSLRDWAEDLLSESSLSAHGLFQAEPIRNVWETHLSGTSNQQYLLWDILIFQQWYRTHTGQE